MYLKQSIWLVVALICFLGGRDSLETGERVGKRFGRRAGKTIEETADEFQSLVTKGIDSIAKNKTAWKEHLKLFEGSDDQRLHAAGGFNCSVLPASASIPTSVHKLRPGDIKVVAAMGDSLTAGFGMLAKTPVGLLTEYRGRSWSIGGDETLDTVVTLPNLFRKYNPNLMGFATGEGRINSVSNPGAHLDVAVSGAKAEIMQAQATKIIDRVKNLPPPANFESDWKLVTLFIGANDLCAFNKDKSYYSAQNYYKYLKGALETLKTMPRTFVNLVEVLEATMVRELGPRNPICNTFHKLECPDFMEGNLVNIEEGRQARIRYQKMVDTLAGEYENEENFTVVHQPFFKDTTPPKHAKGLWKGKVDLSYFAPDCFHFSAKADAAAAEGLWNNIFEAEHEKRTSWKVGEPLVCPTEVNPFLKTAKNSNSMSARRRGAKTSELDNGWNDAKGEDIDPYPIGTGSGATWSFVAVLVGIAAVAFILYYVKTRHSRQADSERNGLLNQDGEDTLFDGGMAGQSGGHLGGHSGGHSGGPNSDSDMSSIPGPSNEVPMKNFGTVTA